MLIGVISKANPCVKSYRQSTVAERVKTSSEMSPRIAYPIPVVRPEYRHTLSNRRWTQLGICTHV